MTGPPADGRDGLERPSAELGPHSAQPVLQEALFGFAGRQGHCGVKFSSSLARVAEPTQVVRQGGVPHTDEPVRRGHPCGVKLEN